uniref:DNA/RNA helicase domain-containing protein n=1 Tax=Leuconostoc suionicum TaxID=1511761 RepID=UPI00300D7C50
HLLLSKPEPYMHYNGNNQLTDLMYLAKIVVVVYDFAQVFQSKMNWSKDFLYKTIGNRPHKLFDMNFQYRMIASESQVKWMDDLTAEKPLYPFPNDSNFEFKVFDKAGELY